MLYSDFAPDERELVELARDECLSLLALELVGRVATASEDGAPDVVPVNYVLHEGAPIFRTHDGTALERLQRGPVSFEVDRFDWFHHTGWSVLVQGVAKVVALEEVSGLELESWAPGRQMRFVRIEPTRITGRRIELHQDPTDAAGYL